MTSNRYIRIMIVLLFIALLASVALNLFLFVQSRRYYLQLNETRLDPLGLSYFSTNAGQRNGRDAKVSVVFFGDSRAANWPEPAGFTHLEFINRGIGAQTSAQTLLRFDDHVTPLHPQIIILQVGVNDLKTVALFPERRDAIIFACKDNIRQIIERSIDLGATVILTTIFPVGEVPLERRPFWSSDVAAAIDEVNAWIRSLEAPTVIVFDAYAILAEATGSLIQSKYAVDELHLNEAGYRALNTALRNILATFE